MDGAGAQVSRTELDGTTEVCENPKIMPQRCFFDPPGGKSHAPDSSCKVPRAKLECFFVTEGYYYCYYYCGSLSFAFFKAANLRFVVCCCLLLLCAVEIMCRPS